MITLSNLHKATAQQVFDQVAKHLLTQRKASKSGPICLYRGPENLKCAAGCLISDEEYNEDFERNTWRNLLETFPNITKAHVSLISILQNIHDSIDVNDWEDHLKFVANNFKLNFNF